MESPVPTNDRLPDGNFPKRPFHFFHFLMLTLTVALVSLTASTGKMAVLLALPPLVIGAVSLIQYMLAERLISNGKRDRDIATQLFGEILRTVCQLADVSRGIPLSDATRVAHETRRGLVRRLVLRAIEIGMSLEEFERLLKKIHCDPMALRDEVDNMTASGVWSSWTTPPWKDALLTFVRTSTSWPAEDVDRFEASLKAYLR